MPAGDSLAPLLNAVSDDPLVKEAARDLALDAIAQAKFLLHHGSYDVRARMVASLLPSAVASMKQRPVDENAAEMRTMIDDLMTEVRGE